MRKCHECGATKGLKAIVVPYCDDETHNHQKNGYQSSICRQCYFETCSCEEDAHSLSDCLEDPTCQNHKESHERLDHWDDLDYNYKRKVLQTVEAERQT